MLRSLKQRFFPVDPVLPGYRQPKNRHWQLLRNTLFLGTLIFVSLFYGLLSAIFPVWFYVYLLLPILVLAALVIWALPDGGRFPDKVVEALFWVFLYAQLIWPNYVALVLPGLPWISANRLITGPLALIFLVSLSQSRATRAHIADVLRSSKFITRCFIVLAVLQVATLAFSSSLGSSVNKLIDIEIQWNLIFFISVFVFSQEGRARKLFVVFPWLIILLMTVSLFEYRRGGVLWANIIPSFMIANDEPTQRILQGASRAATGIYRLQSIYSTPINYSEILGLSTPFFIYWAMYAKRVTVRLAAAFTMLPLFWVILRTDSRLGVVGYFAALIFVAGFYGVRRWIKIRNDVLGPAITLFYPFASSLFLAATFVSHRLGGAVWGSGAQTASDEGRKLQWANAWPKLGSWPLGSGPGMGAETLGTYNTATGVLTIDSYYLVILLEYGVIGFMAWLGMLMGAAVQATKWGIVDETEDGRMLSIMATFVLVFFIVKDVLAQDDSHGVVYMVLGMIVGTVWRVKRRANGLPLTHGVIESGQSSEPLRLMNASAA